MSVLAGLGAALGLGGDMMNIGASLGNMINSRRQREREDTAHQRAVADMTAAGLNPILAAGNPASSNPMALSGPRTGATMDALSKAAGIKVQEAQNDLYDQQKVINAPAEKLARNELATISHLFNSGGKGNTFMKDRATIMQGEARSKARLYEAAEKYKIPVEMMAGPAGQAMQLNEIFGNSTSAEKARLLGWMAALAASNKLK